MLFSLRSVVVLGAVGSSCVCGQDAYKMDWSTDIVAGMDPVVPGEGLIGPDGPWQAVRVLAGSRNRPVSGLQCRACLGKHRGRGLHKIDVSVNSLAIRYLSCGPAAHLHQASSCRMENGTISAQIRTLPPTQPLSLQMAGSMLASFRMDGSIP